jgi:ribonuclease HI
MGELAYMFWCVWQRRNKALYQDTVDPIDAVYPLVQRLITEYFIANEVDVPHQAPIPVVWSPSSVCEYKVNFDAAVSAKLNITGVGVVIRNDHGIPMAVACQRYPCVYDTDVAEALAAKVAIQLAWDMGMWNVEMEGDSSVVINALRVQEVCLATYGDLILDVQHLARSFHRVQYGHVRRDGNTAAHVMARKALELQSEFLVWLEEIPNFLEHVIQAELILDQ